MSLRLLILAGILQCSSTFAQNCLDEFRHDVSSSSNELINGTKWIYEKKNLGSPMLVEKYWPQADILYKGMRYTGVLMNYDVYINEIIVSHAENGTLRYVVISKDYLSGFSYTDTITHRKHQFEYVELPGVRGKALYENAMLSNSELYIKPVKKTEVRASGKGQGEFTNYYEYYLKVGNTWRYFHSKNQLIRLLAAHGMDVKRYIRKNNIKINNTHPEPVISVLSYFDSLN
jgi:hypothetical protein